MRNIVHAAILAVVTFFLSFALVWLELPGILLLHQFDNSSGPSDSNNIATLLVNFTLYMLFWYLAIRVWKSRRRWKIVGVIVAVVGILITGTVVIPNFLAARTRPQEMAALQTIRSISTAQSQYHSKFGRYAGSLSELVGPSSEYLLPEDLAAGTKGGDTFSLHSTATGYTLNANPVKYGSTGGKTFFDDETGVIRVHSGREPATAANEIDTSHVEIR